MSVINHKRGPIYDPGTCRCCGASKKCRILNAEYEYLDRKEIYSDLFVESFGLVLSHLDCEPTDRLICAMCVSRLREAYSFKQQVLQCEEKLLQSSIHVHDEGSWNPSPIEIKTEVVIKPENEVDYNMDHCDDDSNNVEIIESIPTPAPTYISKDTANNLNRRKDDSARLQLLQKIHKMKDKLRKIQHLNKPPKPQNPPPPTVEKFVDKDTQNYDNIICVVENSYVCPFQTSYSTYFCVYCKDVFGDPAKLRDHNLKHDPKEFKLVYNFRKATHIDIERIDCRLCDQKISDMEVLKTHLKEVHKKKLNDIKEDILKFKLTNGTISCTECCKSFVFFHALKRHMAEHFGSFICDICGYHYFDWRSLDIHTKNCHKPEKKYSCHECGKIFRTKHLMSVHVSSVHKKEAVFQCRKCDAVLFSTTERYRHMQNVHGEAEVYPCESCEKVYTNIKNLREHNRIVHLKIFKHRCGICDRGFALPSRLNEHVMSMHRNERSFYCDMCGKSYPRLHYLKLHIQSHSTQQT